MNTKQVACCALGLILLPKVALAFGLKGFDESMRIQAAFIRFMIALVAVSALWDAYANKKYVLLAVTGFVACMLYFF